MKQQELKKFILAGAVGSIDLLQGTSKGEPIDYFEVWVSGINDNDSFLRVYGLCLETERGGHKTYTSADRALKAIRNMGWKLTVKITLNDYL